MPFQIIRNDITKVKADAIVNTANPKPTYGDGTDAAIFRAAGEKILLAERRKIGVIAEGEAAETPAFKLDAKYIIHTVGPVWHDGNHGEMQILQNCYENSLKLAEKLHCKSIAFPLIAAGVNGFPKDKALSTAMSVIQSWLMEHSMKVLLVVFDKKAFELSGKVVENVREYVSTNYVEELTELEYTELEYTNNYRGRRKYLHTPDGDLDLPSGSGSVQMNRIDIAAMLTNSEKTFGEKLFEIIDSRGLTGPQVYKNYISKQVFSKLQADMNYHPNKYTAIALCLSLHLDVDQTLDLIGRAGWTLSPSSKADLIVKACIINHEYNVCKINCILFDYDCPELEKIK